MEPKKKIILYHLGKINKPIANFEANAVEAKLCVDLLNRNLLTADGKPINPFARNLLRDYPFYYLCGENNKAVAYYVGLKGLLNINDDPKFEEKIVELCGIPERPGKSPLHGGRKNSDNLEDGPL